MSTLFLFILLVLLTVGQALQQGTADNDTIKLTLEDIFSLPDLDKRMYPMRAKKLEMIKVALVKEHDLEYPHHPLWFIETQSNNFKFKIDTYGVCSSVPLNAISSFRLPQKSQQGIRCPERNFSGVPHISGKTFPSRISFRGVTWNGHLMQDDQTIHRYGTFGLSLADTKLPKNMHTLSNLLMKFRFPVFALSLSEHGSEFHIGGIEETSDKVEYYKVVKTSWHQQNWRIGQLRVFVGNTPIVPDIKAVPISQAVPNVWTFTTAFDSSTPYIYGPPSEVNKILDTLHDAHSKAEGPRPVVYFQWEGRIKWPLITKNDFLIFRPGNPEMKDWVLGTGFTYPYYMVHVAEKPLRVGIRWGPKPPKYNDIYQPPPSYESIHDAAPTHESTYHTPPADQNRPPHEVSYDEHSLQLSQDHDPLPGYNPLNPHPPHH